MRINKFRVLGLVSILLFTLGSEGAVASSKPAPKESLLADKLDAIIKGTTLSSEGYIFFNLQGYLWSYRKVVVKYDSNQGRIESRGYGGNFEYAYDLNFIKDGSTLYVDKNNFTEELVGLFPVEINKRTRDWVKIDLEDSNNSTHTLQVVGKYLNGYGEMLPNSYLSYIPLVERSNPFEIKNYGKELQYFSVKYEDRTFTYTVGEFGVSRVKITGKNYESELSFRYAPVRVNIPTFSTAVPQG